MVVCLLPHSTLSECLADSRLLLPSRLLSRRRKAPLHQAPSVRGLPQFQLTVTGKAAGRSPAVPLEDQLANLEDLSKWEAARAPLLGLAFSDQEANHILAKSFGWSRSTYWGEEKAKTMPDAAQVQKTLNFLRSIGLTDAELPGFLKKFPEVFGCLVEEEMQKNVQILEKEWGMSGSTLRSLLLRNPNVLGYNVDCKGDCMGQCTRCWVRF